MSRIVEQPPSDLQRLPEDREIDREDLPHEEGIDAGAKIGYAFQSVWTALAPYLSSNVAEMVFDTLGHQRPNKQNLTLLVADIRGFTSLAELADPEEFKILNAFFAVAIESVLEFGGTVDKFQGDAIMATFSTIPGSDTHERRAVKCALQLRSAIQNLSIPQLPLGRIRLGIGISTGIAAVGCVGSSRRRDYTAIGDLVNVAHRLQSISEPDQIIISRETCERMGADLKFKALGNLKLRGRTEPVTAYAV